MDAASVVPDFTGFGGPSGVAALGNASRGPTSFTVDTGAPPTQGRGPDYGIPNRKNRSPSALWIPPTMTEARLNELEAKLAFAEDLIETLNQTVIRQQAQLDSLQQQLRLLHQRLQDMQPEDDGRNPRDELPPHY